LIRGTQHNNKRGGRGGGKKGERDVKKVQASKGGWTNQKTAYKKTRKETRSAKGHQNSCNRTQQPTEPTVGKKRVESTILKKNKSQPSSNQKKRNKKSKITEKKRGKLRQRKGPYHSMERPGGAVGPAKNREAR